jgi:hypothetical protein
MITIDSYVIKNIQGASKSKRSSKKDSITKYFTSVHNIPPEASDVDSVSSLSLINPFLFLQEMDEYGEEKAKLKEAGDKILSSLNDLRFSLIKGELKESQIINIQSILTENLQQFKFPELQSVIDDIALRCEVELAKIEISKKKSLHQ